ncbi:radial spoke head protein 3 homolog B-like isoform X2 [Sipha flava]|uniref:Radial spoke head protein 3 homolog B-like isoform X2 n=1 Tax=Sipha flava TaxID=143950 RepID=A0A8B8GCW1_9HEMI|nr:radial spoke head protein 3 homolog B-like isoform X2 [Sipha flava]
MRDDGTTAAAAGSDNTSSSSFVIIGDGGGDDGDRRRFARNLDAKLKKLQRREGGDGAAKRAAASRKPVFVTTVKTGIFLDPPPDLAALLGLDHDHDRAADSDRYYSYSSKPRALYDQQHQRQRRTADRRPDMCKQTGYTNIMHDKRVVRGSNYTKNIYFGKESLLVDREAECHRRTIARKRAMDYQSRALRLHLGAPKLSRGRQDVDIQTDVRLEQMYEYPHYQTFGAQTEFDQDFYSNPGTGTSDNTDASTQVDDKDLFDFDVEVTPIAETLISDVFRQAMREVLYEDELDARARQQRALNMRRKIEGIEKQRLEFEEERLNKVITDHAQLFDEGVKTENTYIYKSTSDRVTDLLPTILNDLNRNGFITNTTANIIKNPEFVPWLVEELQENKTEDIESDEMLKSIIYDLAKRRLESFNEITTVQNIPKPKELFEEIETVTLQSDQKIEKDNRTADT